jgi:hypothetical protein
MSMAGSDKISFRQGAKGYRHIGTYTYARLLQRGMKRILPEDDNLCSVHLL